MWRLVLIIRYQYKIVFEMSSDKRGKKKNLTRKWAGFLDMLSEGSSLRLSSWVSF